MLLSRIVALMSRSTHFYGFSWYFAFSAGTAAVCLS